VRNILKLKFDLGLFENPYVDETASAKVDYAPAHLEAAKQSAIESAILLKNEGDVLPLDKAKTILVTGPLADAPYEQMGTWAFDGQQEHTVTPLTALRQE
jgi:beta-glucosidase